mgnify:CR=1 FL=1
MRKKTGAYHRGKNDKNRKKLIKKEVVGDNKPLRKGQIALHGKREMVSLLQAAPIGAEKPKKERKQWKKERALEAILAS